MLHGISAYSSGKGIHSLIKKVDTVAAGVEICASNRAIGDIGVLVSGTLSGAFDADCWSHIGDCGRQESIDRGAFARNGMIAYANNDGFSSDNAAIVVSDVIKSHIDIGSKYAEFWVKNSEISAVWVKSHASASIKKAARVIARRHHVPVMTVPAGYNINGWLIVNDDDQPSDLDFLEERICGF